MLSPNSYVGAFSPSVAVCGEGGDEDGMRSQAGALSSQDCCAL